MRSQTPKYKGGTAQYPSQDKNQNHRSKGRQDKNAARSRKIIQAEPNGLQALLAIPMREDHKPQSQENRNGSQKPTISHKRHDRPLRDEARGSDRDHFPSFQPLHCQTRAYGVLMFDQTSSPEYGPCVIDPECQGISMCRQVRSGNE